MPDTAQRAQDALFAALAVQDAPREALDAVREVASLVIEFVAADDDLFLTSLSYMEGLEQLLIAFTDNANGVLAGKGIAERVQLRAKKTPVAVGELLEDLSDEAKLLVEWVALAFATADLTIERHSEMEELQRGLARARSFLQGAGVLAPGLS
jgi:hypothetical protein